MLNVLSTAETTAPTVTINEFRPDDQEAVRNLILHGLKEHWGSLDPSKNPDLIDISASYGGQVFLVAREAGEIVGCGALVQETEGVARIVRMSIAAHRRRLGIGQLILWHLVRTARRKGYRQIILETTETWQDAVSFYERNGFRTTHFVDGDRYFVLDLDSGQEN
jgi:ribosomal protein S18 acetylase RimI-like enzyme